MDVEVGNYNDREFTTVSMRLGQYLHWLEEGNGTVGGSQVYLAQWRAEQDVCEFSVCVTNAYPALLDTRGSEITGRSEVYGPPFRGRVC